jgi:hypothetical protein
MRTEGRTSRTTPEEAFAEARAAMERGDWDGVFACVDPDNLLKISENGVSRFLVGGEATADAFTALCGEHDVPGEMVAALHTLLQRISESARASVSPASRPEPGAMLQQSLRHKQIVDEYRKALKATLKAVPDLARFTAALERAMRAEGGGGSVSSRLFVDEILEDVSITGTRAWATRRSADGQSEDVGFVRRKGEWYVRVLAKRPGGGRG